MDEQHFYKISLHCIKSLLAAVGFGSRGEGFDFFILIFFPAWNEPIMH